MSDTALSKRGSHIDVAWENAIVMAKLIERVTQSFSDAKHWGRNSKIYVATETLYGIPMSWIWFY